MKLLHKILRPAMAISLGAAQYGSFLAGSRTSVFSSSLGLLSLGVVLIIAGLSLFLTASRHCQRAINAESFATSGPFEYIRHPIYASVYLLCAGLGLVFFTWLHFLVLAVFLPFWWIECRREEEAMRQKHGEAYVLYQEHTSMVIPGVL